MYKMVGCIPGVLTLLLTPIMTYVCMSYDICHVCHICQICHIWHIWHVWHSDLKVAPDDPNHWQLDYLLFIQNFFDAKVSLFYYLLRTVSHLQFEIFVVFPLWPISSVQVVAPPYRPTFLSGFCRLLCCPQETHNNIMQLISHAGPMRRHWSITNVLISSNQSRLVKESSKLMQDNSKHMQNSFGLVQMTMGSIFQEDIIC